MFGFLVMFGHQIIHVSTANSIPVFSHSVPQPPFGETYIKAATNTLKSVHNMVGVAVNEAGDRIGFITEHISKSVFTMFSQ